MLILTTDTLPFNLEIVEVFGLITTTSQIQLSQKGIIQAFTDRNRNEQQEAIEAFIKSAPEQANVIYGVKISTASASFNNGTFMSMTYYGTAARYIEAREH